jgi:membrane fusion protein, multidrug efflux system
MSENTVTPTKHDSKTIGRTIGWTIIIGAVIVIIVAVWTRRHRPQTDDATLRANFTGIAPEVSGRIVALPLKDNQFVNQGDLLFEIDPRPYEHALARAQASLTMTRREVSALERALKVGDAAIARAEALVSASTADIARYDAQRIATESTVNRAENEFKLADAHLQRLEPLLAKQFATADTVDVARTRRLVAEAAVQEAGKANLAATAAVAAARAQLRAVEAGLEQAKVERLRAEDAIGRDGDFNARISASEALLQDAQLNLEHCHVKAPFSGRVVNLNFAVGAFARAGVDVFTLVDTGTWFVIGNFRETQLKFIQEGSPAEVYVQFKGGKRFQGRVVGLGWAVVPENGASAMGLPSVPRNLDWVRLAQRFPVRIQVENPDDSFRMGASAVVTITGAAPAKTGATNR